ncbi:hypothetical protein L1987_30096 [Smallanthus sonchifolius]|uniref:Uncharacterized protein n=1 Tax=Smallanthus sonchifolius TaxID=185202 RepID=A0ACB9I352_9ASTR|nr:hypothetical protein L1987_30096 [Smallanthus sonchifolius]
MVVMVVIVVTSFVSLFMRAAIAMCCSAGRGVRSLNLTHNKNDNIADLSKYVCRAGIAGLIAVVVAAVDSSCKQSRK